MCGRKYALTSGNTEHHLDLAQPLQLFDENVNWISGEVFPVRGTGAGDRQVRFLVQATKQHREKPITSVSMVSLDDDTLQREGEERELNDELAGYAPCGVAVHINENDGPILVLRNLATSKTLFRPLPSLQTPTNVISEFEVDFGFLKYPSSSLRPVIDKLTAHFTLNGLSHILHRTFLSKSNHVEEAISKFASLGSSNDRTVFLDLLKTNVKNYWDDEQSILFVSSSSLPNNGLIVRKRGLSILIPKDVSSTRSHHPLLAMTESSLISVVQRGAQKAIHQILHTDCESLSLEMVQDLAMDNYPENQVLEGLAGTFGNARNFAELAETMAQKYVDADNVVGMTANDGNTVNAVMLTELLRKRAAEIVVETLSLVVALSIVRHQFFPEDDYVLNVVSRCNFILVQEARKAGLVLRVISGMNGSRSEPRLQQVGPLHKVTSSFFPGCNLTALPVAEDKIIFTEMDGEEESNPIWAWASKFRYGQGSNVGAWGNPIWARIKRAVFHHFAPWNLRLQTTNKSSFTWTVLSRCQDFAKLKAICEGLREGGYAQVEDVRITSLLEGCVYLWEARNGLEGNKTELLGSAKEAFIRGTPILALQSRYFRNVAKLFQGISSLSLLEVLRLARLTSEQEEDVELISELFEAALDSSEYEEALGYLLEVDPERRGVLAVDLVQTILDNHAFHALLSLPFEHHSDVLENALAVVKKHTNNEASLGNEKTFRVFYAFFMRHSYHGAAADLAFRKAWLDELEVNRKYQSEQNALQLCLAAAAYQPKDMYVGSSTIERGNNEVDHEFHYEKDVVRRLAKARVQSAFSIALRQYKYKMANIPDDPCALFRTVLGWLRQNCGNLRGAQDELLLALYELCSTWHLSDKDLNDYFQIVGEVYRANLQLLDNFVRSLFSVQMDGMATQQIRGVRCVLEKLLEQKQSPEAWWVDLLRSINGLPMYVEMLSEHGFWLRATCLAIELVPDTLDISKPAQLPVSVLEKILSRAKRFRPTSDESVHVVDVLDDASFHSLKAGVDELERKLKRYFGIVQNHREVLLGGLARG